jgi:hypothetical protein
MYFRDLLTAVMRRWYVVMLGLVLTALLCLRVVGGVDLRYEADGRVLLLPPKRCVERGGNPYLYLGGLTQALDVLIARLQSEQVMDGLADTFPDTEITVAPDVTTTGPIIAVTVAGPNPNAAIAATQSVMAAVPVQLNSLQDDLSVPETSRITSMVLTVSEDATPNAKARNRLLVLAAAGGVALSLLLAGFVDGLLRSRRGASEEGGRETDEERSTSLDKSWHTSSPLHDSSDGGGHEPETSTSTREGERISKVLKLK